MKKTYLISRLSKFIFFALATFFIMLFISCFENQDFLDVNKNNIEAKLEEAFSNIIKKGDDDLSRKVLEYIKAKNVSFKKPQQLGLQKYFIANQYLVLNQYDLSEANYVLAIDIFQRLDNKEKLAACYNELALLFFYKKEYSRALEYLLIALKNGNKKEFPEIAIDVNYNLMALYTNIGKLEKAEYHAKNVIYLVNQHDVKIDNLKFAYDALAASELANGNIEMAKKHLDQALLSPCENECFIAKKIFYEKYASIYINEGNHKLACEYYEMALTNFEKYRLEKRETYIAQVETELNLKKELDITTKKAMQEHRFILYSVLTFLGITILYTISVLKQRQKIKKALDEINALNIKLQNTSISKDIVNLDLKTKKNEIQNLLELNQRILFSKELKLSTIKENISKIAEEISGLSESNSEIKPNYLFGIEKRLLTVMTDDGLWKDFKVQFEQIRPDFFKKLKKLCPDLSVNDMKHCSYIISNLKNKDVANLINVSARSVETARYRIKKKMNLDKNQDLYSFLQKL